MSPVFTDVETAKHSISENVEAGVNIDTAIDAIDAIEDSLSYTLRGDDADKFDISVPLLYVPNMKRAA